MNGELLRLIDALHREKEIDKEILFEAIEGAIATAIRKRHNPEGELEARVDRLSGAIEIFEDGKPVAYPDMGRIQAQTAKQVIIQKIREAERDVIYAEYEDKVGTIVNGNVQRIEAGNVIVNLGRAEGILPRQEKIRGENYQPGDRIKALIYDVKKMGQKVKILLTRASPELVVRLFELEVPEIGEKIIEIKRIAREPGYRTKIAVSSYDMRVDCIGACVGIRGSRIKSITDELNDEKIDIIRWNDSAEVLIINALKPAQISSMTLDEENRVAYVQVPDDMLSLAIGRKGQNVRLASKLTEWDIRIQSASSPAEAAREKEEDPELAGVRQALFQGTSFEAALKEREAAKAKEAAGKEAGAGEGTAAAAEGAESPAEGGVEETTASGNEAEGTEETGSAVAGETPEAGEQPGPSPSAPEAAAGEGTIPEEASPPGEPEGNDPGGTGKERSGT